MAQVPPRRTRMNDEHDCTPVGWFRRAGELWGVALTDLVRTMPRDEAREVIECWFRENREFAEKVLTEGMKQCDYCSNWHDRRRSPYCSSDCAEANRRF